MNAKSNLITLIGVKELWTIPGKKPPCDATIWRRRRNGLVPKPRLIGTTNLYDKEEVIRLRNEAWGITS